jgi:hypothetical protein
VSPDHPEPNKGRPGSLSISSRRADRNRNRRHA